MKNKTILIVCILVIGSICIFPIGKNQIDYSEYELFVENFYSNRCNTSFDKIKQSFYNDRSSVRLDVYDSKLKDTVQLSVFEDSEKHEVDKLNSYLKSLGYMSSKVILYESIENIMDVAVPDLYCYGFKVKYESFETTEYFWLKKQNNKICIYQYGIGINAASK